MSIVEQNGFWLAVGIAGGILVDAGVRVLLGWLRRPVLRTSDTWKVVSGAGFLVDRRELRGHVVETELPDAIERKILVRRLKVENRGNRIVESVIGKGAAENVRGTIEFGRGWERRICWYEEPRPSMRLNQSDHSFLDVYATLTDKTPYDRASALAELRTDREYICFPTENGWGNLMSVVEVPESGLRFKLRLTAANAGLCRKEIEVDRTGEIISIS